MRRPKPREMSALIRRGTPDQGGQSTVCMDCDVIMRNVELKGALVLADLIRKFAHVEEARAKQFVAIVRFVRNREAKGPARDLLVQIDRDKKLCRLLVEYEEKSEIIGMVELVRALKKKQSRRGSNRTSHTATAE